MEAGSFEMLTSSSGTPAWLAAASAAAAAEATMKTPNVILVSITLGLRSSNSRRRNGRSGERSWVC